MLCLHSSCIDLLISFGDPIPTAIDDGKEYLSIKMAMTPPLGASSIASYIARSLPTEADPQLKSATEAVAVACHAGLLAVGFKLVGLGEEHRLGTWKEVS